MSVIRTESDSDFDEQTVSRAAPGKNKNRLIENQSKDASSSDTLSNNTENLNAEKLRDIVRSELQALNIVAQNPASQSNNKPSQFRPRIFEQQGYRPKITATRATHKLIRADRPGVPVTYVVSLLIIKLDVHSTKPSSNMHRQLMAAAIIMITARV